MTLLCRNGTKGRVNIEIEVSSNVDRVLADLGMLPLEKVRRVRTPAVVDSGATHLVLPASVVAQLGLSPYRRTTVKYADQRSAERDIVGNVWLELQGRKALVEAIVEPDRSDALVGAIPLEAMDFLIDCLHNQVIPRDPNTTISEVE
jgi:predicted aspartyl protease